MFIKYNRDDGSIITEEFDISVISCIDGITSYIVNGETVYKIPCDEIDLKIGLKHKNKGQLIIDKINKALEMKLPFVDLTMDLEEQVYD